MCLCLSVCLSARQSLCLSVCLSFSVCLSVSQSVCLSLCFSVSACLYVCLSVSLSLSVCLSLCVSLSVYKYKGKLRASSLCTLFDGQKALAKGPLVIFLREGKHLPLSGFFGQKIFSIYPISCRPHFALSPSSLQLVNETGETLGVWRPQRLGQRREKRSISHNIAQIGEIGGPVLLWIREIESSSRLDTRDQAISLSLSFLLLSPPPPPFYFLLFSIHRRKSFSSSSRNKS